MQTTDMFANTISAHLNRIAEKDALFAVTLKKAHKNIKDCCTYILNEVKKSGRNGFVDEEIFGMAVHYYDEDDLKPGAAVNCKVVVNHSIDASKDKMTKAIENRKSEPEKKKVIKKVATIEMVAENQTSLF